MNIIYGGISFQCIAKANIIIEGIDREGITNLLVSSRKILLIISFCWWEDLGFFFKGVKRITQGLFGNHLFYKNGKLFTKNMEKKMLKIDFLSNKTHLTV